MQKRWVRPIYFLWFMVGLALSGFLWGMQTPVSVNAQASTPELPTVTSTPSGPMITVRSTVDQDQINVRSGPGMDYEKIGTLLSGQQAPAKGRTPGGAWIMIDYPGVPGGIGWVYASLVDLSPGPLPVVEPPPTPTPLVTPTIDPTMAAEFVFTPEMTRMPTYTPPAPLVIPTFAAMQAANAGDIPMGLIIIFLAVAGIFIGLFSLAQGR